jgi:hypothetical protein
LLGKYAKSHKDKKRKKWNNFIQPIHFLTIIV